MRRDARVALWFLAALLAGTWLIPALSTADPLAIGDLASTRLLAPGSRDVAGQFHLLGTDRFGRDLFVRMMLAGRLSLAIGVGGSLAAALVGTAIGAVSGWFSGPIDRVAMAVTDALLAVPRLVLLLVVAALWRPGAGTVLFVLAATGWMAVARLVRAEVLGLRARPWADAAVGLGNPPRRVLLRHVVPNALAPVFVATTLGVGSAILLESGLAYLGLGVQPPHPSWGNMIAGGRDLIVQAPWVALAPGFALIVSVLACTVLGDALRDGMARDAERSLGDRV